jgi:hypothetical protein
MWCPSCRRQVEMVTPEQAAPKIDLTSHKADFPQIQGPGAEIRGVRRMYSWMDEKSH